MYIKKAEGPRTIRTVDGNVMSLADLPSPETKRWVASRKAAVVRGVAYGLISQDDALERYHLSEEEFLEWVTAVTDFGVEALKTTSLQKYRHS